MENRIKFYRKAKYYSQQELAERCQVSRQTINAIENGKYDPSLSLAFSLAHALEIQVDHLFLYEKKEGIE